MGSFNNDNVGRHYFGRNYFEIKKPKSSRKFYI